MITLQQLDKITRNYFFNLFLGESSTLPLPHPINYIFLILILFFNQKREKKKYFWDAISNRTCSENQKKNSLLKNSLCHQSSLVCIAVNTEAVATNGIEFIYSSWHCLQAFSASYSYGFNSDCVHFPVFHYWSFLQPWNESSCLRNV